MGLRGEDDDGGESAWPFLWMGEDGEGRAEPVPGLGSFWCPPLLWVRFPSSSSSPPPAHCFPGCLALCSCCPGSSCSALAAPSQHKAAEPLLCAFLCRQGGWGQLCASPCRVRAVPPGLQQPCLLLECSPGAPQWAVVSELGSQGTSAITALGSASLPCCTTTLQGCALVPSLGEAWRRRAGMAAGCWSCSLPGLTWLWHLLDSHCPSQKAGGVSRAGPGLGRAGPGPSTTPRQSPGLWDGHWGQSHSSAHMQVLVPAELR